MFWCVGTKRSCLLKPGIFNGIGAFNGLVAFHRIGVGFAWDTRFRLRPQNFSLYYNRRSTAISIMTHQGTIPNYVQMTNFQQCPIFLLRPQLQQSCNKCSTSRSRPPLQPYAMAVINMQTPEHISRHQHQRCYQSLSLNPQLLLYAKGKFYTPSTILEPASTIRISYYMAAFHSKKHPSWSCCIKLRIWQT